MSNQTNRPVTGPGRPTRRLKPEVAAKWAAHRREAEIQSLYQTPVDKLSPEEIARMKAAFLKG